MQITLTPVPHEKEMQVVRLRWEEGGLSMNGKKTKAQDGMVIPYSEEMGCSTFSDDEGVNIRVIPSTWVNPTPAVEATPVEESPADLPPEPEAAPPPEPTIEA